VAAARAHVVTHCAQGVDRLGSETGFEIKLVGQVLVVEAWCIDGLLDVEAALGRREKDVGYGGDDAASAR
jgi:hypothetical protein